MNNEIIEEIKSTWKEKFYSKEEWPSYKRLLLKYPDRIQGLDSSYFDFLTNQMISQDLSKPYELQSSIDFFNSLLRLRKTDCIIKSLKTLDPSLRNEICKDLDPKSIFISALFRSSTFSEFVSFFDSLDEDYKKILSFQIVFKVVSIPDISKLSQIINHYNLAIKSLEIVVKAWSDQMFLIQSLWHNKPLTVFIHNLMTKNLPSHITTLLYSGIQNRLCSTNKEIALSGMLIASRVAQLLDSNEIIKYSIEDFLKGNETNDASDEDENEFEVTDKVKYLEETVNGLNSENKERFLNALDSCAGLVLQELEDLDLFLYQLAESLMKLENKFSSAGFEDKRFTALVSLCFVRPAEMVEVLIVRIEKKCSIGDFVLVMDVLKETSRKLANVEEKVVRTEQVERSKYYVIQERLKKKTKRFFIRPKKENLTTRNLFLPYFEIWVGRILGVLNEKLGHIEISKTFYTLGELIENTGGTCDIKVVQQCVYIIKKLKPFISSPKREISESSIYMLINISTKLDNSPLLSNFESILQDLHEISLSLEKVCPELQDLATKALLLIAYY